LGYRGWVAVFMLTEELGPDHARALPLGYTA